MIKVENVKVYNFDDAIIGMRNPMNSWAKSDSSFFNYKPHFPSIGQNDLKLMHQLLHGGSPHDKFMRQILCSMQITAPLYWWKEMDTYKVATVANSTSTMHKIHSKPIELSDFSFDLLKEHEKLKIYKFQKILIDNLEWLRQMYLETKDNTPEDNPYWRSLIQLLPESYNQTRMWTANYATLREIYKWRSNHKLVEWRDFCNLLVDDKVFPYGKELIAYELDK